MPDALPPLVLRADANARIASGHLMRCLALALEWRKRGGEAEFVSDCGHPAWRKRIVAAGFPMRAPAGDEPPKTDGWLVIDGYHFDSAYLKKARAGARTLVVDDHGHRPSLHADILLNQNLGAEKRDYALDADTLPLLGPRYALLRPEFTKVPERSFSGRAKRVLITLGGSDPENATAQAVAALPADAEAVVLLGAAYAHEPAPREKVRYVRDASDIPALMAWAEMGVIAGGATAWEACFTGLPCLVLVLAENQAGGAAALDAAGAAVAAGERLGERLEALLGDAPRRTALSKNARALVDGRGAARVVDAMLAVSSPALDEASVTVREVSRDDVFDVWRLANEPAVRASSFTREPIPLEGHRDWFEAQLGRTDARFWALEAGGTLAAQVRYVREPDGSAEVHFSVRGAFRGKGLGTQALARTGARACRDLKPSRLRGVVIAPNPASQRAFEKAGYAKAGERTIKGKACLVFEKPCS